MGVKTTMNWTVHLRAPAVPTVKAEEHFPEVVRLMGMQVEQFTIGSALDNAEGQVQRVEKRYRTRGVTALVELLQAHPLFIHHPRVARLYEKAITEGGIDLPRPSGRPKGPEFLDEPIIYSVVERLRHKPFGLSLRKSWEKVGESWQSSFSSVRDAYERAKKIMVPFAIAIPTLSQQPDSGAFTVAATEKRGRIKLAPGKFVYRKLLTGKVQIVYELQCEESGNVKVQGWFEIDGKHCDVLVKVVDRKLMMAVEVVR